MKSQVNEPTRPGRAGHQRCARWILPWFPAMVMLLVYLTLPGERMHEDEIYWIGSAYYYHLGVVQHDAASTDWQLLPARENPALGKYVIGAALHAQGKKIETPDLLGSFYLMFANVPGAWGTGEAFQKRRRVAARVDPAIAQQVLSGQRLPIDEGHLRTVRGLMLWFGMIAAAGIAVIGRQCDTVIGGLIAGLLFGLHPIVIPAYSLAMIDMVALCFSIWFVSGLIAIIGDRATTRDDTAAIAAVSSSAVGSWTRRLLLVVATAALLALACGSKMNSLVVVVTAGVCGLYLLVQSCRDHQSEDRPAVAMLSAVLLLAGIAFVATNPTLYGDTADGMVALSYEHRLTADIQEQILGGRLRSLGDRLRSLSKLVCVTPALFAILVGTVAWQGRRSFQNKSMLIVVVVWWVVTFALLLAWLPFAWERYALPLIPPTVLILGATLEELMQIVWARVRQPGRAT